MDVCDSSVGGLAQMRFGCSLLSSPWYVGGNIYAVDCNDMYLYRWTGGKAIYNQYGLRWQRIIICW